MLFAVQETEWWTQGEAHSIPPSLSTHADVLGDMGLGFTLVPITLRYRISSIRCERGYHVHKDIWEASQRENSICADPFTVTAAFCSRRER